MLSNFFKAECLLGFGQFFELFGFVSGGINVLGIFHNSVLFCFHFQILCSTMHTQSSAALRAFLYFMTFKAHIASNMDLKVMCGP